MIAATFFISLFAKDNDGLHFFISQFAKDNDGLHTALWKLNHWPKSRRRLADTRRAKPTERSFLQDSIGYDHKTLPKAQRIQGLNVFTKVTVFRSQHMMIQGRDHTKKWKFFITFAIRRRTPPHPPAKGTFFYPFFAIKSYI